MYDDSSSSSVKFLVAFTLFLFLGSGRVQALGLRAIRLGKESIPMKSKYDELHLCFVVIRGS